MIKKVLRDLLIAILAALAVPGSIYFVTTRGKLGTVVKGVTKMGQKVGAPILNAARLSNGRIANWASGRGRLGRTFGRVMTGTVYPGGRSRMETMGEAGRKAQSERVAARGSYRATPSKRMNAEALERTSVEAIQRWVNNPRMASDVAAVRQMVVDSQGAIKLSTAQREALFSGYGNNPAGGASMMPTGVPAVPGGPSQLGPAGSITPSLGNIDRPASGAVGMGPAATWWRERPSVLPGVRQTSTRRGIFGLGYLGAHYLGGGNRQWGGWLGRVVGRGYNAPPPGPPPGP